MILPYRREFVDAVTLAVHEIYNSRMQMMMTVTPTTSTPNISNSQLHPDCLDHSIWRAPDKDTMVFVSKPHLAKYRCAIWSQ